jgi:hypothetical protein
MPRIYTHEDLSGNKYNRLKVLKESGKSGRQYLWECLCDCGTIKIFVGKNITSGNSKGCGCHKKGSTNPNFRHGLSGTREYFILKAKEQHLSYWDH